MSGFKNFLQSPKSSERRKKQRMEGFKTAMEQHGSFLTEPRAEVSTHDFASESGWCHGSSGGMQGWRVGNEDAHVIYESGEAQVVLGMYDGHGGKDVAGYLAEVLHIRVAEAAKGGTEELAAGLPQLFAAVDAALRKDIGAEAASTTGATCNVCVVGASEIVCANTGDCRAVLCRDGKAIPLSVDHNPNDPGETARIEKTGSKVLNNRIDGMLNVSRAFGDFEFKKATLQPADQCVTPLCDVTTTPRAAGDAFLIQACDGIWGALSSQEVVDFVAAADPATTPPAEVISKLCERCLAKESDAPCGTDNMSINLLVFKQGSS
eukprot:TRINITY_DN27721_c0_g1_i1.p1 TRINITY_DN27721_c0_g1~~TRINITY_DN27721_c0_g1_i1.p1  ORF type:complete len:321 (+),score=99.19 TRINITY_DN27721_c0_g1_i1:165-1127(+)